jgi:hypothetical protein
MLESLAGTTSAPSIVGKVGVQTVFDALLKKPVPIASF